jgi:hypothetical protein
VLRPYTYYVNHNENLVWITDEVPLLGVRNGAFVGLVNAIDGPTYVIATGMNADWTTLASNNCQGWSRANDDYSKHFGNVLASDIDFLYSATPLSCSYVVSFYCVEQ